MSQLNGVTATSVADLISQLNTFIAATPAWTTVHNAAGGEWSARKTPAGIDIAIATQWDTGDPQFLGIYQWLNAVYNAGADPWAQTDDSGNGAASTSNATLVTQRFAGLDEVNDMRLWVFEDDHYFHAVVEWTFSGSLVYTHFGAGYLDKYNDWTGGEYVYGGRAQLGTASDAAILAASTNILDGILNGANMELNAATLHIEGMDDQVAGGKYAVNMGAQGAGSLGNDRQAAPKARIHTVGGFRAGPGVMNFGQFAGTLAAGLLPIYSFNITYLNRVTGNAHGPLGVVKDIGGINIKNYVGGQELTIGSDTWVVFPSFKKWISGSKSGTTGHQGIAYKKITT